MGAGVTMTWGKCGKRAPVVEVIVATSSNSRG